MVASECPEWAVPGLNRGPTDFQSLSSRLPEPASLCQFAWISRGVRDPDGPAMWYRIARFAFRCNGFCTRYRIRLRDRRYPLPRE
jgi:hypothetical protein